MNWVRQDVLAYLNETGLSPAVLSAEMLAELVGLVTKGTISRQQASDVLSESLREEKWPRDDRRKRAAFRRSATRARSRRSSTACLAANPGVVDEYRAGDEGARKKKRSFLMGRVMGELKGQGNPQVINKLLDDRLS